MPENKGFSLPIGTILNEKWVILEFIAKGGMGEIYRAHQLNLKRDVAVKVVSKEWLDDFQEDQDEKENALRRFRQEVHTMAQIRHPNVIQIYDFDRAAVKSDHKVLDIDYIALEYIPGRTLQDTMREEGFWPNEKEVANWIRAYFLPVLDGVEAIHTAGIFHRDLKPENVLLDGEIPKIADFGLARSCRLESVTCSTEIKGTPAYMAPEQFMDFKRSDQRADIYSLGKILYEAIEGKMAENQLPFTQVGLREAETDFFKRLEEILKKATQREPEKRFGSIKEFRDEINDALALFEKGEKETESKGPENRGKAIYMSRWLLAVIGVVALVLVIALSFWGYHYYQEHGFNPPNVKVRKLVLPKGIPLEISARDGTIMRLVPGGSFFVPKGFDKDAPRSVKIRSFYMDETPVTNQQFVSFLNRIRSQLSVENGAVKNGSRIYLYLGDALQGYEPIVLRKGFFRVKNPGHSACPVIRVTAYGAAAYATFFNKRLATSLEWLYAAAEGNVRDLPGGTKGVMLPESFLKPMRFPYPVVLFRPNFFGIKGMNVQLGCWVQDVSPAKDQAVNGFAIMAGFDKHNVVPQPVRRNPWEAFEEVGFRCVKDLDNQARGQK